MDNQFRKKTGEDSYAAKRSKKRVDNDDVINLYDDFKDPNAGKLDPEVEELKLLAQSDALRFYGWLRRWLSGMGQKLDKIETFKPTKKHLKWARNGVIVLAIGFIGYKTIPNVYQNITEERGILGESKSSQPEFNTLSNPSGEQPGVVFDPDANVVSFQDRVGGVAAIISQQEMPADIQGDQSGVEKLALSLSDKSVINRFETNKGQIYVIEAQSGNQTVILGYEDLLIFIRTDGNIDEQLWVEYVNGLKFSL